MGAVNTVTICEDGKRWVSQIGKRHWKTQPNSYLLTPLKFIERTANKKKHFCWWPMDSIRISICYADSANARLWPLSSWELTWRYDVQHAVLEQMCGIAQKWLATSWQIMAHHLVAGIFFGLFIHHLWTNFDQRDVFPKRTWNDYKPPNCVYQTYFQGKVSSKNMFWRGSSTSITILVSIKR